MPPSMAIAPPPICIRVIVSCSKSKAKALWRRAARFLLVIAAYFPGFEQAQTFLLAEIAKAEVGDDIDSQRPQNGASGLPEQGMGASGESENQRRAKGYRFPATDVPPSTIRY